MKTRAIVAAILLAVMCLGSRCNQDIINVEGRDPEITMVREILLLNDDVINLVDDLAVERYDGSDESFEQLERTVCILETWQLAEQAAWQGVRIWELAKMDYQRRADAGEDTAGAENDMTVAGSKVMTYVIEVARLAILVYDIFAEWGRELPEMVVTLLELLGTFIGEDVTALEIDCSEVFGSDVGDPLVGLLDLELGLVSG